MRKRWKRRYPGLRSRAVASIVGVFLGLYLVALMLSRPLGRIDLPLYAIHLIKTNHELTRRDVALIYALSQEYKPVDLSTSKQIVFSSFPGFDRIDISERLATDAYGNAIPSAQPFAAIISSSGGGVRYFSRTENSGAKSRRVTTDANLNHAAITAFLDMIKGGDPRGAYKISVCKFAVGYEVSITRDALESCCDSVDLLLGKDFKPLTAHSGEWITESQGLPPT